MMNLSQLPKRDRTLEQRLAFSFAQVRTANGTLTIATTKRGHLDALSEAAFDRATAILAGHACPSTRFALELDALSEALEIVEPAQELRMIHAILISALRLAPRQEATH